MTPAEEKRLRKAVTSGINGFAGSRGPNGEWIHHVHFNDGYYVETDEFTHLLICGAYDMGRKHALESMDDDAETEDPD